MTTTTNPQAMLADLYRRARLLASEEAAQPGLAAALCEESAHLFREGGEALPWVAAPGADARRFETIRERIRRISIVALRRQALATRQAWVDGGGPAAGTDEQATALIAQAFTFGEAALALHRDGDSARDSTRHVVAFLQSTLAIAQSPPKGRRAVPVAVEQPSESAEPPAVPMPEVAHREPPAEPPVPPTPPADLDVFVAGEERDPRRVRDRDRAAAPARRPALVPALTAIAVAGFLLGFVFAPRIWRGRASAPEEVRISQPAVLSSPALRGNGVPAAGRVAAPAMPRPIAAPPSGGPSGAPSPKPKAQPRAALIPPKVAIVLRSEPSGAQVFIGGIWQGATPLRLDQPAGALLRLTVRLGARVWRGTLQVGERSGQVLMIRLPESGPVTARSTPAPPAPTSPATTPAATPAPAATAANPRKHFQALMAQGVELYRAGWYGPAMARFRTASAVRPDAPSPYLWLARAALQVGRTTEARGALEQVIAMAPASAAAREASAMLSRLR